MKINCIHGYFIFDEVVAGQLSNFISLMDVEIVRSGNHFTFSDLVDAPKHSIAGGTFLGCPTTENFEGYPWEVMRANGIVYDFNTGAVVPIETILSTVKLRATSKYFIADGMIIPGSVTEDGSRVKDYAAFFDSTRPAFKYSEVFSE